MAHGVPKVSTKKFAASVVSKLSAEETAQLRTQMNKCNACFGPTDGSSYTVWCSEKCRQRDLERLLNGTFANVDEAIKFQQTVLSEMEDWEYKIRTQRHRYKEFCKAFRELKEKQVTVAYFSLG